MLRLAYTLIAIAVVTTILTLAVMVKRTGSDSGALWHEAMRPTYYALAVEYISKVEGGEKMSMNAGQLRALIRETLEEVDLYSKSAEELLMLTAAVESNLGEYIEQTRGPALGVFQMEPLTHDDIMDRWLQFAPKRIRDNVKKFLDKYLGNVTREDDELALQYNLKYAILLARLKYYTIKSPLPPHNDLQQLASYWKRFYNTPLGKGTVAKAIEKYNRYVDA